MQTKKISKLIIKIMVFGTAFRFRMSQVARDGRVLHGGRRPLLHGRLPAPVWNALPRLRGIHGGRRRHGARKHLPPDLLPLHQLPVCAALYLVLVYSHTWYPPVPCSLPPSVSRCMILQSVMSYMVPPSVRPCIFPPSVILPSVRPRLISPSVRPRMISPSVRPRMISPSVRPPAWRPQEAVQRGWQGDVHGPRLPVSRVRPAGGCALSDARRRRRRRRRHDARHPRHRRRRRPQPRPSRDVDPGAPRPDGRRTGACQRPAAHQPHLGRLRRKWVAPGGSTWQRRRTAVFTDVVNLRMTRLGRFGLLHPLGWSIDPRSICTEFGAIKQMIFSIIIENVSCGFLWMWNYWNDYSFWCYS